MFLNCQIVSSLPFSLGGEEGVPTRFTNLRLFIRESVDSLCRDGADTPISLNIQNCSKLPNAAVISFFRHITWSWSSSVPDNSLKVGKIICYSDTRKTAVFSRQTYHKIGTSAHLHFCTKQLLSGVCMILDKEILRRTFPNEQN